MLLKGESLTLQSVFVTRHCSGYGGLRPVCRDPSLVIEGKWFWNKNLLTFFSFDLGLDNDEVVPCRLWATAADSCSKLVYTPLHNRIETIRWRVFVAKYILSICIFVTWSSISFAVDTFVVNMSKNLSLGINSQTIFVTCLQHTGTHLVTSTQESLSPLQWQVCT